ncbi:hypothetical protein DERF_010853 [Dermatophagoides farinae]|uniref:Uncharacterized protein n=1 Tax=Dermatophagoides farinae TaxID=6954 RepID=A0A922L138_DERFA|nr:hypothetical protein DERF_010853 [Dermatophagoides farinae]
MGESGICSVQAPYPAAVVIFSGDVGDNISKFSIVEAETLHSLLNLGMCFLDQMTLESPKISYCARLSQATLDSSTLTLSGYPLWKKSIPSRPNRFIS